MAFRKGDLVLVPFPASDLQSTKTRPALVVGADLFTAAEGRLLIAAITSNLTLHQNAVSYEIPDWQRAGLLRPSIVTSWLACVGPSVVIHPIGTLEKDDLDAVDGCLRTALGL